MFLVPQRIHRKNIVDHTKTKSVLTEAGKGGWNARGEEVESVRLGGEELRKASSPTGSNNATENWITEGVRNIFHTMPCDVSFYLFSKCFLTSAGVGRLK